MKNGKGKWRKGKSGNENIYEGEYKDDKKNGYGEFKWATGNTYKGNYLDDERHGFGTMAWIDGSQYEGEWVRGIQHGWGKMSFPGGVVKEGWFENNVFKEKKPDSVTSQSKGTRKRSGMLSDSVNSSLLPPVMEEGKTISPMHNYLKRR